jgi:hypothetical protein
MEIAHINEIDSRNEAPTACPCCGGRITFERFKPDADTGDAGCDSWSCGKCDKYWIAPLTEWSRNDE